MNLERLAKVLGPMWASPEHALHGLFRRPEGEPVSVLVLQRADGQTLETPSDFVLFPIGEILRRLRADPSTDPNHMGVDFALQEHAALLLHSIQRLGDAEIRMEEAFETGRFSFNESRDLMMYYDATLTYSSIMCDDIARILTQMYDPPIKQNDNMSSLIHNILKDPPSPYDSLFPQGRPDWFSRLKELRNPRFHRHAVHGLMGPRKVNGVPVSTGWTSRLSSDQPPNFQCLRDDIKIIAHGLFGFLDQLARYIAKTGNAIDLSDGSGYWALVQIPLLLDSTYLGTMIPCVEPISPPQ